MSRLNIFWIAIGLLILSSLACNAFAGAVEPALTLPPPPVPVGETPVAADDDTCQGCDIAPTATMMAGDIVTVTVPAEGATVTMLVNLNVRSGPGVHYERVGSMLKDESAGIVGKDPDSGWWKIACPTRIESKECWVSGSSQYTLVAREESVPVAAVPPTPTPIPPTPDPDFDVRVANGGLVVYGSDDRLWAFSVDLSQDPPAAGQSALLAEDPNPITPYISPDGRKIAYVTNLLESNTLHVVDADGSNGHVLISSADIPMLVEANMGIFIGQLQWLGNSQGLAFNTSVVDLLGPGEGVRQDLWTIMLDGALRERFGAGNGGGSFAVSRNNQVIMSQSEAVVRANLDGANWETLITFDLVNTASEYIYYPRAQWTRDDSRAHIAIPSQDQFGPDAEVALWRIPSSGPAEFLGSIPGNILFNPVLWSANGDHLAYVQQVIDGTNTPPSLALAGGNGQEFSAYSSGELSRFYSWNPNGDSFLFAGNGYVAIGRPGVAAIQTTISIGAETADARWLTSSTFVVSTGGDNKWRLESGNLSGQSRLLTTANTDFIQYDAWAPQDAR
jgi:hypothetical protein